MEEVTYTAPSSWASYLINGDASGLVDPEEHEADTFIESVGLGAPVGCEDAGFIAYHDARTKFGIACYGADCQTYTFLRKSE